MCGGHDRKPEFSWCRCEGNWHLVIQIFFFNKKIKFYSHSKNQIKTFLSCFVFVWIWFTATWVKGKPLFKTAVMIFYLSLSNIAWYLGKRFDFPPSYDQATSIVWKTNVFFFFKVISFKLEATFLEHTPPPSISIHIIKVKGKIWLV